MAIILIVVDLWACKHTHIYISQLIKTYAKRAAETGKHLNGLCSRLGPWVGQSPSSQGFRGHRYIGEWQESSFKQSKKFWPLEALWETLEEKLGNQKECVGFMWLTTCRPNPCHEVTTQLECRKQVSQILHNDNQSLSWTIWLRPSMPPASWAVVGPQSDGKQCRRCNQTKLLSKSDPF